MKVIGPRMKTHLLRIIIPTTALSLIASPYVVAQEAITFQVVATFDYPNSAGTTTGGINDAGVVAGVFSLPEIGSFSGYVRFRNGSFSAPIEDPRNPMATAVTGVNNLQVLCGFSRSTELDFHNHGFVWSNGGFTYFDVDGSKDTTIEGINDAGNTCGGLVAGTVSSSWVKIGGLVTTFQIPAATSQGATSINNLNECAGVYTTGHTTHGFFRDLDGTLHYPIDVPGADFTFLFGLSDNDEMVGSTTPRTGEETQAVYFSGGRNVIYQYPDAVSTHFTGINSRGLISGYYQDASLLAHGFIVRVKQ